MVPAVYFFFPETAHRSLEEIDEIFLHANPRTPWDVVKVGPLPHSFAPPFRETLSLLLLKKRLADLSFVSSFLSQIANDLPRRVHADEKTHDPEAAYANSLRERKGFDSKEGSKDETEHVEHGTRRDFTEEEEEEERSRRS